MIAVKVKKDAMVKIVPLNILNFLHSRKNSTSRLYSAIKYMMYDGIAKRPTRKSATANPRIKVFEGVRRDGVLEITMMTIKFENIASRATMAFIATIESMKESKCAFNGVTKKYGISSEVWFVLALPSI